MLEVKLEATSSPIVKKWLQFIDIERELTVASASTNSAIPARRLRPTFPSTVEQWSWYAKVEHDLTGVGAMAVSTILALRLK